MLIPYKKLVEIFQTMYKEHWAYDWSGHERGKVGCAGAFVYAYNQFGASIYNGSNRIFRTEIVKPLPISEAKPGMAAFKFRSEGEPNYKLPADYKKGGKHYNGDLNDYYHIGLVDMDTRYVLNAQGEKTGFVRSPITQNWDYVAYLIDVDYSEGGEKPMEKQAVVVLPTGAHGKTVNMRRQAHKSADILEQVPVGAAITILNDLGDWCKIRWGDKEGYMMANYIEYLGQSGETDAGNISVDKKELEQAYDIIGNLLGLRG